MTEERVRYLLDMAAEVRAAAQGMRYPEARQLMSQMAEQFERLAHRPDAPDGADGLLIDEIFGGWTRERPAAL
jgi:hypothetical protein